MGRFTYYLRKLFQVAQQKGLRQSILAASEFISRRVLSGQLFLEPIEYHLLARTRDVRSTLIQTVYEKLPVSQRWMIYASYDSQSVIQPHVLEQLEAFQKLGYAILFVSTSPTLSAAPLIPFCAAVLHRTNEGYDFASWKLAYELYRGQIFALGTPESFILMNDSCLGPYGDLGTHLRRMMGAPQAVYGITKSYEIGEYIQSYFYHFGKALPERTLDQFMSKIRILYSKWAIVRFFEIGLSHWLRSRSIAIEALVDPREIGIEGLMREKKITDPVQAPVADILRERGVLPFYKRSNAL